MLFFFFCQAEDGIRDAQESRGLGDVYKRQALAFRWIITYARARNEKSMDEKLAAELIAASKNEGASIKKREDTHKMAEANKAFAHLRF